MVYPQQISVSLFLLKEMNNMKMLYLYPFDFEKNFLKKDVGLIPKYLVKHINVDFVYFDDYHIAMDVNEFYHDMSRLSTLPIYRKHGKFNKKIKKSVFLFTNYKMMKYVFQNAKSYTHIFMFHYTFATLIYCLIVKFVNPKSKIWVKMDIDLTQTKSLFDSKSLVRKYLNNIFTKSIDFISCETIDTYEYLINKNIKGSRITYLPNGIDQDEIITKKKVTINKKNTIITVGRIGTFQKNTELFLDVLSKIDLDEWNIYIIGPYEDKFKEVICQFFVKNPKLKRNVHFTGPIFDRDLLQRYFIESKCFILSSRFESYGLVLNEAMYYKNYIISTAVGAAPDLIKDEYDGELVSPDSNSLRRALIHFIENESKIMEKLIERERDYLFWENIFHKSILIDDFLKPKED